MLNTDITKSKNQNVKHPTEQKPIDTQWTNTELENYKLHRRFDRMGRLVGDAKMQKLAQSHVMVIGLGGVGSWAAEMLVRSGIGRITLVDFDEVCITNFNRQVHAVGGSVGEKKAIVLAERFKKINPACEIKAIVSFYNKDNTAEIFGTDDYSTDFSKNAATHALTNQDATTKTIPSKPDFVIDAIDSVTSKCMLLDFCVRSEIPVLSCTGSAGKLDPTMIKIADLNKTAMDPLAKAVRRILRQQYNFKERGRSGIMAVYSDEPSTEPQELNYDGGKGFKCVCPQGENSPFSCDNRNLIMGSAGFVTSSFGMVAASHVVRELIKGIGVDAVPMNLRNQKLKDDCEN